MIVPQVTVSFGKKLITIKSEKTLARLHDELWNRMDRLIKKYNPCRLGPDTCYCFEKKLQRGPFCCGGCSHLRRGHGCTIQSLTCKFHLCGRMMDYRINSGDELPKQFVKQYFELRRIRNMFFVNGMRTGKNEVVRLSWRNKFDLQLKDDEHYNGLMY